MKTRAAPSRRTAEDRANGAFLIILFVAGPVLVHIAARMLAESVVPYV